MPLAAIGPIEYDLMVESGAAFPPPAGSSLLLAAAPRIANDWPANRGLFRNDDPDRAVLVWVNEAEHVKFQAVYKSCRVEEAFLSWSKVHTRLTEQLKLKQRQWARHERLGWVGFDPQRVRRIRLEFTTCGLWHAHAHARRGMSQQLPAYPHGGDIETRVTGRRELRRHLDSQALPRLR